MKVIHKYLIEQNNSGRFQIEAKAQAKPVLVGRQQDELYMWMEFDPRVLNTLKHCFAIRGTGMETPEGEHVVSFQDGSYVWHIYKTGVTLA